MKGKTQTIHTVVLDYGYGDDEDYHLCFVCDTKEEAVKSAREMGGDHKYRAMEVVEEVKNGLS